MALILCLETSATNCSVALSENGLLIQEAKSQLPMSHGKEITLLIKKCIDSGGKVMKDLDAIAISGGPGSYTGLRVAASTAKGICYALEIPLISINTLHIIAEPYLDQEFDYIIPTIDARRDEIYYLVIKRDKIIVDSTNLILDNMSFDAYQNAIICGDGAEKTERIIDNQYNTYDGNGPLASNMCRIAESKFNQGDVENLAYYSPFYFKSPNITQSKKPLF